MALTVNFYSFGKKDNSTKRPATAAQSVNCVLKDGCGILAPVLILDMSAVEDISGLNYAYISDFGRYYFVDEWTWERGVWIAAMSVDPLASWKEEIGDSTHYILRSSAASDGNVMDTTYPTLAHTEEISTAISSGWASTFSGGAFIVSIMSGVSTGLGGVTYYYMTYTQFANLVNYLMSDDFMTEMDFGEAWTTDAMKAFLNPIQYITSAMWVPEPPSGVLVSRAVKVGWWTLPSDVVTGYLIPATDNDVIIKSKNITVAIPKHPQASARGNYLNLEPYSRYTLYYGPFGAIPIDSSKLIGRQNLNLEIKYDLITGKGAMWITANVGTGSQVSTENIGVYHAQIGVPVSLSGISKTEMGVLGTIAKDTLGFASGSIFGAESAITGAINGIGNAYTAMESKTAQVGSTGSLVDFTFYYDIVNDVMYIADEYNAHIGRPLNQARQISTIPGYIKCLDGDVEIAGTSAEISAVKSALEGGFFYE